MYLHFERNVGKRADVSQKFHKRPLTGAVWIKRYVICQSYFIFTSTFAVVVNRGELRGCFDKNYHPIKILSF